MRLLVLGGTKFLGRARRRVGARRAGTRSRSSTAGTTNPELFPEVEKLRGDRDGDLDALRGREWDAVVDPSGYVPRMVEPVRRAAPRPRPRYYVFVSSISVYADFDEPADRGEPARAARPEHRATS